jgi:hypothetical protein
LRLLVFIGMFGSGNRPMIEIESGLSFYISSLADKLGLSLGGVFLVFSAVS